MDLAFLRRPYTSLMETVHLLRFPAAWEDYLYELPKLNVAGSSPVTRLPFRAEHQQDQGGRPTEWCKSLDSAPA